MGPNRDNVAKRTKRGTPSDYHRLQNLAMSAAGPGIAAALNPAPQDSGVMHGPPAPGPPGTLPPQYSGVTHGPSAPGGAFQRQPTGPDASRVAPLSQWRPAAVNPGAVYNTPGGLGSAPRYQNILQVPGWEAFFENKTQIENAPAGTHTTGVPALVDNLTTLSFNRNAYGTQSASAQAASIPSVTNNRTTPSRNDNTDAQASAQSTRIAPLTTTSTTSPNNIDNSTHLESFPQPATTSTASSFNINNPTPITSLPHSSGPATISTPFSSSTLQPTKFPNINLGNPDTLLSAPASNISQTYSANFTSPDKPRYPLPRSVNNAPAFASMAGNTKADSASGKKHASAAKDTPGENSESQPTPTITRGSSTAKSVAKRIADQGTTVKGSSKNTAKKSRKGKAVAKQPEEEPKAEPEEELPFRIPNLAQMLFSDEEDTPGKTDKPGNTDKPAASSSYALPAAKLPEPERPFEVPNLAASSSYATPAAKLPEPNLATSSSYTIPAAQLPEPERPFAPSSTPMNKQQIPETQNVNMAFDTPVQPVAPGFFSAAPVHQAGSQINFVDAPILPCALYQNRYVDSDVLPLLYTSLEDYIQGTDNNGGVLDEMDRLHQMGVQAGIGHGITVFKTMLMQELKYTGRLFGRKVARDYVGQTHEQQSDIIQNCDFYERSGAKLTAESHIEIQKQIRDHMAMVAQTQGNTEVSAQSGVVSGYSIGPEAMEDANTPAMPGLPGHHMPDTHANLAALAGVPTIGGLDLTQMDGYAGLMTNAFADAILGQTSPTASGQNNPFDFGVGTQGASTASGQGQNDMFVFGAGNQDAPTGFSLGQQHPFQLGSSAAGQGSTQEASGGDSAPMSATPVLAKTKDGRAVIKLVPEKQ